jgi:hypothetical protein
LAKYHLDEESKERLIHIIQLLYGVERLAAISIVSSGLDGAPCEAFYEALKELVSYRGVNSKDSVSTSRNGVF